MIRSDWKKIIFVKSLMGTKLDSIFFIWAKFTKFALATKIVVKNNPKLVKELSVLFLIISLKIFFDFKVFMETLLDSNFSSHSIIIWLQPQTQLAVWMKKNTRCDQRPSYMIRLTEKLLCAKIKESKRNYSLFVV